MWQLILGVYLTGLRDTQIAGKACTCLLVVILEEISIWISALNKEDLPLPNLDGTI